MSGKQTSSPIRRMTGAVTVFWGIKTEDAVDIKEKHAYALWGTLVFDVNVLLSW